MSKPPIERGCNFYNCVGYEIAEEYVDEGFARTIGNWLVLEKLIEVACQRKFDLMASRELSRFANTPIQNIKKTG